MSAEEKEELKRNYLKHGLYCPSCRQIPPSGWENTTAPASNGERAAFVLAIVLIMALIWLVFTHIVGVCTTLIWAVGIAFIIYNVVAKKAAKYSVGAIALCIGLTFLLNRGCSGSTPSAVTSQPSAPTTGADVKPAVSPARQVQQSPKNAGAEAKSPPRNDTIPLPKLDGTPYEALSKSQKWIADYENDVSRSLRIAISRIQAGNAPDKELAALETHLTQNKRIISDKDGLASLLIQQEQKMTDQIKQVERLTAQPDLDSVVKQQYADTLTDARKSLDAYRICQANVDILRKRTDDVVGSCVQWKTYYQTTSGITGPDSAKTTLLKMLTDAQAGCEKRQ